MFSIHLPKTLYEHLPTAYAAVALLLCFADLAPIRFVAVISLLLAAVVTRHRRRRYRDARRRAALRERVSERYPAARRTGTLR